MSSVSAVLSYGCSYIWYSISLRCFLWLSTNASICSWQAFKTSWTRKRKLINLIHVIWRRVFYEHKPNIGLTRTHSSAEILKFHLLNSGHYPFIPHWQDQYCREVTLASIRGRGQFSGNNYYCARARMLITSVHLVHTQHILLLVVTYARRG